MSIKALGNNYFSISDCPINICKIENSKQITHEFDLTEVEHIHDFIEIVLILKGRGIQIVEGHEYNVGSGDIFVLQGNQKHYFKDASQLEIINVMYDESRNPLLVPDKIKHLDSYKALFVLEPKYRDSYHFKNSLSLNPPEMSQVEMILNAMFHEQNSKMEGFDVILSNLLQELIIVLSRYYGKIDTKEAKSLMRIANIVEELEMKLNEKIYIKDLAEKAYMSERNFQRVFLRAVGISPLKYLMQSRLKKSVRLLLETDSPIADIAIMTGFADSNHFIKNFRKSFGTTPYKYRNLF